MSIRLCPSCRRIFPPGVVLCPDHGVRLIDDPVMGQTLGGYQVVTWIGEGLYAAVRELPGASSESTAAREEAQVLVRILPTQAAPSAALGDGRASGTSLGTTPAGEITLRRVLGALRAASDATDGVAVVPQDGGVLPDGRFFYLVRWPREARLEPLRARLARAPRALPEALDVTIAICRAVEAAQAARCPPSLLRAESVLLHSEAGGQLGRVHLLDLGLDLGPDALGEAERTTGLLQSSVVTGGERRSTESAVAVLVLEQQRVVYAIGALLYHLATGVTLDHASAFAGPGSELPHEFQAVTLRALAARPADRQPTVAALRKDLLQLLRDARPRRRLGHGRRSQLILSLLIAGVLVVALVASGLLLYYATGNTAAVAVGSRGSDAGRPATGAAPGTSSGSTEPRSAEAPGARSGAVAARLIPLALRARALDALGEAQRSTDAASRWYAADLIGRSRDPRLRPQAEELLADVEPRVAARAAWALGRLGDRAAVVALNQAAGDPLIAPEVGVALLQLLDRRGLEILRGVLRAPDGRGETRARREEGRLEAALWLGEHGEPEAWRALRRFLLQTQDDAPLQHLTILGRLCQGRDQAACQQLRDRAREGVNGQARVLLGAGLMQAGDLQGVKILREVAKDTNLRLLALRHLAEGALTVDDERWLVLLLEGSGGAGRGLTTADAKARAAEALGMAGATSAVAALSKLLGESAAEAPGAAGADPQVLRAAASAVLRLAALEPELLAQRALNWALAGAADSRGQTRAAAAVILGHGPAVLTAPLLARALNDRDSTVRATAARALGRLGGDAALAALRQGLTDRDGAVRVAVLRALGSFPATQKDGADAQLLREHLSRGTLLEQVAAAGVLLSRGDSGHRFVLQQALQSPDIATRRQVVEEARRDPDAAQRVALLGSALNDTADEVQLLAAALLAREGDKRGVEVLKRQSSLLLPQRLLARDALLRLGESTPNLDLMAVLGAAGEGQRAAAMGVAPRLQAEAAQALLLRGLRDPAVSVRLAAVAALQELGEAGMEGRALQQLLLLVSSDPDPAVQARALGQLARLY